MRTQNFHTNCKGTPLTEIMKGVQCAPLFRNKQQSVQQKILLNWYWLTSSSTTCTQVLIAHFQTTGARISLYSRKYVPSRLQVHNSMTGDVVPTDTQLSSGTVLTQRTCRCRVRLEDPGAGRIPPVNTDGQCVPPTNRTICRDSVTVVLVPSYS